MADFGRNDDYITRLHFGNDSIATIQTNLSCATVNPQHLVSLCVIVREGINSIPPAALSVIVVKQSLEHGSVICAVQLDSITIIE